MRIRSVRWQRCPCLTYPPRRWVMWLPPISIWHCHVCRHKTCLKVYITTFRFYWIQTPNYYSTITNFICCFFFTSGICPAEWNRPRKRLCVILITENTEAHNEAREALRKIALESAFSADRVRFAYIYQVGLVFYWVFGYYFKSIYLFILVLLYSSEIILHLLFFFFFNFRSAKVIS